MPEPSGRPSDMRRWGRRFECIVIATALLAGCSSEKKIPAAFLSEPLLKAPPRATQLDRNQRGATSAGIVAVTSGAFVEVVLATPDSLEAVGEYYRGVDPTLKKANDRTGNVLTTESKLRRVDIQIDSDVPSSSETGKRYVAPPDAKTFISLTISEPISK